MLFLLLSAALLTGCASLPSIDVMKAETATYQPPKLPEEGKAIVYIVRPSLVGTLVRFNVFVDDKEDASKMGYNRGNEYIHFNVTPGQHKILSKAKNWAEAEINANAGDIVFIQQDANLGFVMARNTIFKIDDYVGKCHVKTLTLDKIIKTDK